VAQLGVALARTFDPVGERTHGMTIFDQQCLVSLCSFIIGCCIGKLGEVFGSKNRSWLASATFLQVLLATSSAVAAHYTGDSPYAE
jgi:hypothetical protein